MLGNELRGVDPPDAMTAGNRRSGRGRWVARVVLAVLGLGAIGLIAVAVTAWNAADGSAAAQNGPRAVATVASVHVTSVSGRGGTQYTSHYRVTFTTRSGRRVYTTVLANGDDPCSCARTLVAYDPARPAHAELAGDPLHTRREAVGTAVVAALFVLIIVVMVVVWRRFDRQLRSGVPLRPRHRRLPLAATWAGLAVGGVVAAVVFLTGGAGPSLSLARQVIARAAAGQGTTDCLALVPSAPNDIPVDSRWANDAIAVALQPPVPASSAGYPHWYPASDAFDSLVEPIYLELGGGTPPPGQPSSAYGAWTGTGNTPGTSAVDIWALSSPESAARFADAYVASLCYRYAHHSGVEARAVTPPAPNPPGERCVITGQPNQAGTAVARCVLPVGRYVVRAQVAGTTSTESALVPAAAAIITRAAEAGAGP